MKTMRMYLIEVVQFLVFLTTFCELFDFTYGNNDQQCIKSIPDSESIRKGRFCEIFDNPSISQDDPVILNYLREFHLTPPSGKPYFPTEKKVNGYTKRYEQQHVYSNYISKLFKNKKNGFYIEAGAYDGEFLSNTLGLEQKLNWTGLLVEPDIFPLVELRKKRRNAWVADVCLSLKDYPEKTQFMHPVTYRLKGQGILKDAKKMFQRPGKLGQHNLRHYIDAGAVECFPLYSILSALNQTVVDYFSLDVEGVEMKILQGIPFDKLTIKVMNIEHKWTPEGKDVLLEFLAKKNFTPFRVSSLDVFVVNNDYIHEIDIKFPKKL